MYDKIGPTSTSPVLRKRDLSDVRIDSPHPIPIGPIRPIRPIIPIIPIDR